MPFEELDELLAELCEELEALLVPELLVARVLVAALALEEDPVAAELWETLLRETDELCEEERLDAPDARAALELSTEPERRAST